MNILSESSVVPGLKLIQPTLFHDFRGEYIETFSKRDYCFQDLEGETIEFVEDDISVSTKHCLRGLHGDSKTWKLVQCIEGSFYIVIVDMRKERDTYLNHQAFTLSEKNRQQLLVPAGCVNGHLVMSERAVFSYKQSQYYSGANNQMTVRWDDPKLNLFWPIKTPILSLRDAEADFLK